MTIKFPVSFENTDEALCFIGDELVRRRLICFEPVDSESYKIRFRVNYFADVNNIDISKIITERCELPGYITLVIHRKFRVANICDSISREEVIYRLNNEVVFNIKNGIIEMVVGY